MMRVEHCEEYEIEMLSGLLSPLRRVDMPRDAGYCATGGLEGVRA